MKIKKNESENFYALCHFLLGMVTYLSTWLINYKKFWPVIAAGILWELIVDCWLHTVISDNEGFSIGDVIWVIIGGAFCMTALQNKPTMPAWIMISLVMLAAFGGLCAMLARRIKQ
jgi:hypothetical protein